MRFLFYFFIGLIIFRFITSLFRPRRPQQQASRRDFQNNDERREGEISVKVDNQKAKKKFTNKDGDYVDFEEV